MLWPIRNVSSCKVINASVEDVLHHLHDANFLIELNRLVVRHTPDPSNPDLHHIVDNLTILGIPIQTNYATQIKRVDQGIDATTRAAAGTALQTCWRATAVEGGTEVREDVSVQGFVLLMPFIVGNLRKSHSQMLERMAEKIEGKVSIISLDDQPRNHLSALFAIVPIILTVMVQVIYPDFQHTALFAFVVGISSLIFRALYSARDPYGLFHLSLNSLPGEDPQVEPKTMWMNMGYWKDAETFPEACEALALKVVQAGRCLKGGNVLDVGHGSGDSLLLQLSHPSVPRPARLGGITSLLAHYHHAKGRVARLKASTPGIETVVELYHGDAVYHRSSVGHPLRPGSPTFTTILALDCAYHFNTRHVFLKQCYDSLAEGGRIALADICFTKSSLGNSWTNFLVSLLRIMPKDNAISMEHYVRDMEEIGYSDVVLEDVTEDVFPGFIRFLKFRGVGWSVFGAVMERFANAGARFVIVSGTKSARWKISIR